jgi:hypothetical protein
MVFTPRWRRNALSFERRITLDLYSHVLPGMQDDAAAKIDAAIRAAIDRT